MAAVEAAAMATLPKNMMIPPIPETTAYLSGLAQTSSNPSLAAMQKFFPLRAIWIYAFLLMNWTILSTQARQHLKQLIRYSMALFLSAPVFSACFLKASTISWRNWTTARMKDPKARLPK